MTSSLRVLLLEDRESDAELMLAELRQAGYEPMSERAESEQEYQALLGQPFDVILADYTLPQFDAQRALEILHDRGLDIPFIILTATVGEEIVVESLKRGAADYILKDRLMRLSSAVSQAIEQRRLRERNRQAVQSLAQLRRQHELILNSISKGIIGLDLENRVTFMNPAATRMLGYGSDELFGQRIHDVLRCSDSNGSPIAPEVCVCTGNLSTGEAPGELDQVYRRKDGSSFPSESTFVPSAEQNGSLGRVITIQDVTERRAVERLKEEFVSVVSHELRGPLNGVIGMLDLLQTTQLTARQREFVDVALRSGETLLTTINEILDFSKVDSGHLVLDSVDDLDIRDLVETTASLHSEQAHRKGLELLHLVGRDLPRSVSGDPQRLRQVLTNLVSNAIKFTEQGEVVLRASVASESQESLIVRFEVADTGIGIPAEASGRIFQAFTQVDSSTTRRYGGTGLGLAICKHLVALMGGEIGIESAPGQGSTFWFTARFGSQLPTSVTQAAQTGDLGGLRILVIDDHASRQRSLENQITAQGGTCDTADNISLALNQLRATAIAGAPYDVAILDSDNLAGEGSQVIRALETDASASSTGLILLTRLTTGDLAQAEIPSQIATLSKPVRQKELVSTVTRLVQPRETPTVPNQNTANLNLATSNAPEMITPPVGPPSPTANIRILIVDDSSANQTIALAMLEKLGYEADCAENGQDALKAFHPGRYGAVLLDCQMPVLDGFDTCAEIRRREGGASHRTPVIAMTAQAMRGDRERCLAAGMDDYLAKPIKLDVLESLLRQWTSAPQETTPVAAGDEVARSGSSVQLGSDKETIDSSVINQIRCYQRPGGRDLISELTIIFLRETPRLLVEMREAVNEDSAHLLMRLAHRLQGNASYLGAHEIQELCKRLGVLTRQGSTEGATQILDSLEPVYERTKRTLETQYLRRSA